MKYSISCPIILYEHGDVLMFKSLSEAITYIEPIDVYNKEYVGYDAKGHILHLNINKDNRIEICLGEPFSNHTEDLRTILIDFMKNFGYEQDFFKTKSLEEIIYIASRLYEIT